MHQVDNSDIVSQVSSGITVILVLPLVSIAPGRGVSLTNKPGPLPLRVKHLPLPSSWRMLPSAVRPRSRLENHPPGREVRVPTRPLTAPSFSRCTCNEMSSRYDQAYVSAQFHGNSNENTVIRDVRRCCSSCRASIPRSFLLVICDLPR